MIAVTGATGHLGRHVIDQLLGRGVDPSDVVAAVRSPAKAVDMADRGVVVREVDCTKPDTTAPSMNSVATTPLP